MLGVSLWECGDLSRAVHTQPPRPGRASGRGPVAV